MRHLRGKALAALALVGMVIYALAVSRLAEAPRRPALEEMRVAVPRFAQVLLAGGDRYLAAILQQFARW
jgi:hypothetical protein